jgi:transcriptional regulator with XRE-family HTH domain
MKVGVVMDKYKFGEFIYQKRKQLHMTQDDLGRKLGVTNKAVSKWETGETLPEIQLLELLASTLNVTIDELLTQVPPEKEVVVKKNNIPLILMIFFSLLSFIFGIIVVVDRLPEEVEPIMVTKENCLEYFNITPCSKSEIDGLQIKIYGSIDTNVVVVNPKLTLLFTINLYYINNDGENSQITYVNRKVEFDGNQNDFLINLTPKSVPSNYNSFLGFDVNYTIIEVEGEVIE